MKLTICAVGRLRHGPEFDLIGDYLSRAERAGRALGIGPVDVVEVEDKKASGMAGEAALLRKAIPAGAVRIVLDERGEMLTSPEFADRLAGFRDQGRGHTALILGGADGVDPDLRGEAEMRLSLGRMVWPHMLARVMLAEQLYRAVSILAGSPYHRA